MADARGLIALLLVAAATSARGAGTCDEGRAQTGLTVAADPGGGLVVQAVEPESPAAASGVAAGDSVVQVNAVVARACADWARAVRDARREHKAVLLLVRRGDGDLPIVVAARAWDRAVATATATAPAAEPPTVRHLVASPPPPLPDDATVTLDEVTRGLGSLASDRPSARLETYRHDLVAVERKIETLGARRAVPPDVLDGLHTVAGYYDAAGVAWGSEEAERERRGQPRHIPLRDGATAPYFEDSDVADAIDRFPFLREAVVRDPQPGRIGESAGAWRPRQARNLLWDHGRDELARLTAWLATSGH